MLNIDAQHADWRDVYPRSGDQCLECTRASANNGTISYYHDRLNLEADAVLHLDSSGRSEQPEDR